MSCFVIYARHGLADERLDKIESIGTIKTVISFVNNVAHMRLKRLRSLVETQVQTSFNTNLPKLVEWKNTRIHCGRITAIDP
jgi:hypothetical protein